MNSNKQPMPYAVVEAIQRKFFPDIALIRKTLDELGYDAINGCYYFVYANMYHGVEQDGYIHT